MGYATAIILIAWVCLNVSTKLSAQYVHPSSPSPAAPPPIVALFHFPPKKHKQLQRPLPPVPEPIVPFFPFVYVPSPSEKPYEHSSSPPPPVAVAKPIVPYFPFTFTPSPSEEPYEYTSPPPPSTKRQYRPPLNHLPPVVSIRKMPPWQPDFTTKSPPPPF